ncbi:MAG TPA: endo-1,4-beta-xylanase [Clostridia bacterium]|nr:endo-1,4-beta-xylanase [Clostridia bacterium]
MSSIKLKNWRKVIAVLSVLALVFMYAPMLGSAAAVTVYHETFETGRGAAVQSGGASLTPVTGKVFEGNSDGAALYVSNRSNNWDAADFGFTDIGLENGKTYTITVKGYVDAEAAVPDGAQAFLQCVDSYAWLAGANFTTGAAFTLTGTYTVDTSKDSRLRVQSNDAGAAVPFYIGDVLITGDDTPIVPTDTVYHETFADGTGIAVQSGGANLTQVTGKVFDGNDDGAALYVSGRANNWDAADFRFADIGLENGETYTIKVTGYVDADVPATTGAGAALQTDKTYSWIGSADFVPGQAFALTADYTVDTTTDTAIRIQSTEAGKTIPFYIGDILITGKASGGGEERPPALPFTTVTFEDQTAGGFVPRGGNEILTVTSEDNHTDGGGYCLKVEGRTQAWNGPALRVEKYVDQGSEYKVTAWVKTITPSSVQLQLSTQVGNGSGASYINLQGRNITADDGWVMYEGTYRYNSVGGEFITIYVESSNNATASYYIDDISFVPTGSAPIDIQKDLVPMKNAYQNDFLIGDAISAEDLSGVRLELLKMHCNVATAGNAMKPDALQPTKGNFTFTAADEMLDKVLASGLQMHGHVLAWHSQSPNWLNRQVDTSGNVLLDADGNEIPLGRDEALTNLRTHIRTVMEHFGNKVISWDVVNEAMNDNPSNPEDWKASLRRSPWFNAIGDDYLEQAFLAAREVLDAHPDWNITLYYNDYNDDNQKKATAIYNMVKDLNGKYAQTHPGKLLIDGVGMQGHYNMSTNPANVLLSLERFISLGVKVSISELDIQAGNNFSLPENLAISQGYKYAQLMKIFRDHAASIERVTFWGLDDGTSWRSSTNPTPFDRNLQAKLAYYGVIDPDKYMAEHEPETPPGANQSTAGYATPVIDGTADAVWDNTPAMPINRYQMAFQGANGTAKALWDEKNLYVLVQVSNAELDKASANAWEQDSAEVFVDEDNEKTSYYEEDDGQYRINFDNETSFNPATIAEGFESKTSISGTDYTVEMKIPFRSITPANDVKIGFDAQINDGKNGARQSVAAWNDLTGNDFQDTSVFGVLTLTGKSSGGGGGNTSGGSQTTGASGGEISSRTVGDYIIFTAAIISNKGSNGELSASVNTDTLNSLASKAKDAESKGQKAIVELKVGSSPEAGRATMDLPKDALTKLSQDTKADLRIDMGMATITFDAKSVDSLSSQLTDAKVSLSLSKVDSASLPQDIKAKVGNRPVFDISLMSGNKAITDFGGGKLQIGIPYTPQSGENTDAIIVYQVADNGRLNPVRGRYDEAAGAVICVVGHLSKYAVGYNNLTFSDISAKNWYGKAVSFIAARGITDGIGDGKFGPDDKLTRADFLVMLMRAYQIEPDANPSANFTDAGSAYYTGYLAAAKKLGITEGIGGNLYAPNRIITRQEVFTLVYNTLKSVNELPSAKSGKSFAAFTDSGKVALWAGEAMKSLTEAGVITGDNGRLNPSGNASRAEMAQVLYNLLKG